MRDYPVEPDISLVAYDYTSGIKLIRQGYCIARDALVGATNDAYRAISDMDEYRDNHGLDYPQIEFDPRDGSAFDERDFLVHDSLNAEIALTDLRKAYAIMFYHHWERSARDWATKSHGGYDKLKPAVEELGVVIDPFLDVLNILVNTLKHNSSNWGDKLRKEAPDLFANNTVFGSDYFDWYNSIKVDETSMLRIIDAVANSGPHPFTGLPDEQLGLA